MHRSGTSLLSSILQKAGLFIGDDLLEASEGNEKGHFENIDFYKFHMDALKSHSLDPDGWDLKTISTLNEALDKQAIEIIQKNNKNEWGWKDPRTTLFLKYWENKIPTIKYIFVYRDPWDVADSLYRRHSDPAIISDPSHAFKVWDFYNREIINMYTSNKENSILIHIDDITKDVAGFINTINSKFDFHLTTDGIKDIFDKSIYKPSHENLLYSYITALSFPETIVTLNELRTLTKKELFNLQKAPMDKIPEETIKQFLFNWHIPSLQKIEIENLTHEIDSCNQKISLLTQELDWMKKTIFWKTRVFWQKLKGNKNS